MHVDSLLETIHDSIHVNIAFWFMFCQYIIHFHSAKTFPALLYSNIVHLVGSMGFKDKVIIITGANSGIGASCAEYFAKEGALLALVGRRAEKFESVIEKIKEFDVEAEPLVIVADVSVDAERIIAETIEKYGRLDILINNAGMAIYSNLETIKMGDYDTMMAINTRGTVELTKLALPYLIESKGNVVNVSSIAGMIPVVAALAYSMSKAMMDHFTQCLAMELGSKGVRVNSINPGLIASGFHVACGLPEDQHDEFYETQRFKHPLLRIGYPEDVVHAIAFLADDNAKFITGALLKVDGGLATKGMF